MDLGGGSTGTRTQNQLLKRQLLYQLSYRPDLEKKKEARYSVLINSKRKQFFTFVSSCKQQGKIGFISELPNGLGGAQADVGSLRLDLSSIDRCSDPNLGPGISGRCRPRASVSSRKQEEVAQNQALHTFPFGIFNRRFQSWLIEVIRFAFSTFHGTGHNLFHSLSQGFS